MKTYRDLIESIVSKTANILLFLMVITPIILAILVTIDYKKGIYYDDLPLTFVWPFCISSFLGLLLFWSIGWKFLDKPIKK